MDKEYLQQISALKECVPDIQLPRIGTDLGGAAAVAIINLFFF